MTARYASALAERLRAERAARAAEDLVFYRELLSRVDLAIVSAEAEVRRSSDGGRFVRPVRRRGPGRRRVA